MAASTPMTCPRCGATMNHHAEKPLPGAPDATATGAVEALYACPACGASASRRSAPAE
jgi:predicted RNA-binding Zn-ribbon protein involved in translation (DUF1610 family)